MAPPRSDLRSPPPQGGAAGGPAKPVPRRPLGQGELCGVGFKSAHFDEALSSCCTLDFFEVHAENYMVAGGPRLIELTRLREHHALSVHGVGLGIGGEAPLDARHLDRLAALVRRFEPRWVSEHLAWSSHGGHFFNDLLPLPYDGATLARVCAHVDQVQEQLCRRLLLENPSTYLEFAQSTFDEAGFVGEVLRRTGCALLLDVNNLHVSSVNHGRDPHGQLTRLFDALPRGAVREIHLAGHGADCDGAGAPLLIDDHGAPVAADVWALYRCAVEHLGPTPTLIERDNDLPAFDVLQAEAEQARGVMCAAASAGLPRHSTPFADTRLAA
jgi:uncharacterized protein (UPF0276 family)